MLLGLDFDNTLIRYDELFYRVATERGLIPSALPMNKTIIRDYLRREGREDDWTAMQGEVYGLRIVEALPYQGMKQTLRKLQHDGVPMRIVSHKTAAPYLGFPYDLHKAAREWLIAQDFFSPTGLGWRPEQVFFELTKDEKIRRIVALECTHYIDDLPEILEMLPKRIHRILFSPEEAKNIPLGCSVLSDWNELPALLSSRTY